MSTLDLIFAIALILTGIAGHYILTNKDNNNN